MTNYRAFNARVFTTGQTGSLDRAWGILRDSSGAGTLYLEGQVNGIGTPTASFATMSIADIQSNQPFPCYVRKVEVSAGRVYILA
jgi:hypothetical protein